MSNIIKALIAIVSIIILGSGIFVLTKSRTVENIPNTSISSVSQMISSSSLKVVVSSVSKLASNMPQITSKVSELPIISKTEQSKSGVSLPKTDTVDGVEVVYLDSKNPPQYIKDYLACPTKNIQVNTGMFGSKENIITYNCAPSDPNEFLCPEGIYKPTTNSKGWTCIIRGVGYGMECNISMENIINNPETVSTFKSNYIKAKSIPNNQNNTLEQCLVFTKTSLTKDELKSIAKYNSSFKIINYSN